MEVGQQRVDGREDGTTIPASQQEVGDGGHDADGGVWPHAGENSTDRTRAIVIDDLGRLHAGTGGNVQAGHVATHVPIANN